MPSVQQSTSVSPILDSGVLPPRRRKGKILGFCVGFLLGILFFVVVARASTTQSQANVAAFSYFVVLGLAVMTHEVGHLAAGWGVGFHFNSISLGPVVFGFEYGRMRVRVRQGTGTLGFAGVHIDRVIRLHRRMLVFIAGGPAANLVSAAVASVLVKSALSPSSWLMPVAIGFLYFSLFLGVVGFLPLWPKSRSDGSRIWMLLTSRGKTRRWISTMALLIQSRLGTSPKLLKQTWLTSATSLRDDSFDEFTANWIAFAAASSRKDVPKVTAYLERCLELAYMLPDSTRDEIAREAGIYAAWFRNDAEAAEEWFGQMKHPKQTTKIMQIRVNVVLDCARGDFTRATEGLGQGSAFIESLPDTPLRAMLKESWNEWGEELEERRNQTTSIPKS
jgi:hypothetical protein